MGGLAPRSPAEWTVGVVMAALVLGGCATTPASVEHVVRPGDNLYRLSQHYGVSVEEIRRANDIDDVRALQIGRRLVIPGSTRATISPPGSGLGGAGSEARSGRARRETGLDFGWPVSGKPSSKYGGRGGGRHDGIDIPARRGTPVRAAEAGRVIHSGGGLGDYGQVVIVKHAGRYSTVYAHNRRNRVRKGEFVEKGQVIAEVGSTGNASGPHVHFELRRDRNPEDPLEYLP
jgi:murein DD-endopeptidase MepM/ murein hydrolase activator NlpD